MKQEIEKLIENMHEGVEIHKKEIIEVNKLREESKITHLQKIEHTKYIEGQIHGINRTIVALQEILLQTLN